MSKSFLLCLLLLPVVAFSQQGKDSLAIYKKQYADAMREAFDSIHKSEKIVALRENLVRVTKNTRSYNGLVIFGDVAHSDFSDFNSSIASSGFENMTPYSFRFGVGTSVKRRAMIYDFYFVTAGANHRSVKGNEKILSSLSNVLQVDVGYAIVNLQSLSIYPFAGLSLRKATVSYTREGQVNPSYTNISNLLQNEQLIAATSTRLGYQAGVGLDVVVANTNNNVGAIILFAKGGTNRPFGKDVFKIRGERYQPNITNGDWLVSFGIKFAGRLD